jgi:16S rRNA C967 or C1407 C5-methylase (RsmB/RsmF family)/NOL1/NOP2/fmu family ribosome biogenesis protein
MIKLPEAFESVMKTKLGPEFPQFEQALAETSPTSIRVNPLKSATIKVDQPVLWSKFGRYLNVRPSFTLDPLFHAGTYYVQEASSMFLEQALLQAVDLNQPLTILDLCAAPGGKSTHILSLINPASLLVSNEVIRSRASILSENIQKWGFPNSVVTNNDPKDFTALTNFFDVIVIDAPCSGEGLFRKEPEAMEEWSPQNVDLCSSRQKRIMADVWPSLKENGILIYCTCTYNELENEDNLKWLEQNEEVESIPLTLNEEWKIEKVSAGKLEGYRFYPHHLKGEGFFLSVIRKKSSASNTRFKTKKNLTVAPKRIVEKALNWIIDPQSKNFFQHDEYLYVLPGEKVIDIDIIKQHLRIIHAGTTIASIKHEKLIPAHALAVSVICNKAEFKALALSEDQALQYLRKEPLEIVLDEKGYQLMTFNNAGLGWINSLGNRFNNLYPLEWRIRMARQ